MKNLFLLFIVSPVSIYAQAMGRSEDSFGYILFALIIFIVIFLICRELMCWYWKINKAISNQEEIIRLLKKIAKEDDVNNSSNQTKN